MHISFPRPKIYKSLVCVALYLHIYILSLASIHIYIQDLKAHLAFSKKLKKMLREFS
jgi:hypothetical protein